MVITKMIKLFPRERSLTGVVLALIAMCFFCTGLAAQNNPDEAEAIKTYKLPADAVDLSLLTEKDELMWRGDSLFSGIAFDRYHSGSLKQSIVYRNGLKHGQMMVWYPDGKPQLFTTYKRGVVSGRFVGWYQNGSKLYDMVLNRGMLAEDSMYGGDTDRESGDDTTDEREGTDND